MIILLIVSWGLSGPLLCYTLSLIHICAGVQIINDVSYSIGPGTVIFLHPDDTHSFYSNGSLSMINLCLDVYKRQGLSILI